MSGLVLHPSLPALTGECLSGSALSLDTQRIEETVSEEVQKWLRDIGIAKRPNERLLIYLSSGGTCRDPMARVITLKLLEENAPDFDLQVKAVALFPPRETEASYNARQAIRELYGEDLLAGHRPTMISQRIAEEADLILVMDHTLLNPKVLPKEKTYLLKPFFDLTGDVADPWLDDRNEDPATRYAKCAAELKEILQNNFRKLIDFLRPQGIQDGV